LKDQRVWMRGGVACVVGRCRGCGSLGSCWQYLITVSGASAGNEEIDCWFMTVLRKSCTNLRSAILLRSDTSTLPGYFWYTGMSPEPRPGPDQNSGRLSPIDQMSNLCFLFGFFGSWHEILKGAINAVFCRIFRQSVTDLLAVAAAN